ncbi:probable transporter Mch2p [Trichomonascus vanleenenianus]|uniref:MCT family MFS transporter n=1 Tax=Trichomonascus vanleenenianus TaxID=2268995 RepID=UPI003ECAC132
MDEFMLERLPAVMNQDIELADVADRDSPVNPVDRTLRIKGMLIILASFLCNFVAMGVGFTFGVFQDFYTSSSGPLQHATAAEVSIIGAMATSLTYMCGVITVPLCRRFGPRLVMFSGALLMGLGMVLASFSSQVYQFALTQGGLYGIGSSFLFMPPISYAPQYFEKRRGIALGIAFSGTGIGGLAMGPFSRMLLSRMAWPMALRILGIIAFSVATIASRMVYVHPKSLSAQNRTSILNPQILRSRKFALHISGNVFQAAGYLIPLVYMSSYGKTLGFSASQGALFIGLNNAVNAASKIVFGYLGDELGRFNMLLFCCLATTVTTFALWLVPSRPVFLTFVILNGMFSGPIIALLPACLVEMFGVQNFQAITGLTYASRGLGTMLGSPIAGLFIKSDASKPAAYTNAIIYAGAVFCFSATTMFVQRLIVGSERKWALKI